MSNLSAFGLAPVYDLLTDFAHLDNFWSLFETAFGTQYDRSVAEGFRVQWLAGNFRDLPQVEVISSQVLGTANGAYAASTNTIYISDQFAATASSQYLIAVLLEEVGHFVDAQVNTSDSAGDEGAIFAALALGDSLEAKTLQGLKAEDDHATITINGQSVLVEQNSPANSSSSLVFNTTFNDPNGTYSPYYSEIKSAISAAGSYWSSYIKGNASLEVIVDFSHSGPTATGRSLTTSFVRKNGILDVYEQGASAEIRTGIDPNGITPDIELNFNPNYLINELWFDPDPLARITPVPGNKTDAISVFLHELGHAFAFNGWRDSFSGMLPGDYESTFDEKTVFDGNNFYFLGTNATTLYGSPVPLTFGNYSHLGNNSPRPGSDLISDVMSGVASYRGTRDSISPLDIAILADAGLFDVPTIITLSVSPFRVQENSGLPVTFTFTRTGSLTDSLIVNYTIGGTATNGVDYTTIPSSVTFLANSNTTTVTLTPKVDTIVERDETVAITLTRGAGYTIGTATAVTGTIGEGTGNVTKDGGKLKTSLIRFQNTDKPGTYLFAGEQEAASIRQNNKNFKEEGFAFQVAVSKTDPLMQGFYRFRNTDKGREGTYLFAGEQESASIRKNNKNFVEEGLAFYAYSAGVGGETTIDFTRFQNNSLPGTYLFTGPVETIAVLNNPGFSLEGSAFAAAG